jgi:hypothetical protein
VGVGTQMMQISTSESSSGLVVGLKESLDNAFSSDDIFAGIKVLLSRQITMSKITEKFLIDTAEIISFTKISFYYSKYSSLIYESNS